MPFPVRCKRQRKKQQKKTFEIKLIVEWTPRLTDLSRRIQIPELLDLILSHLDPKATVPLTRVSLSFRDAISRRIYTKVFISKLNPSPFSMFRPVLQSTPNGEKQFSNTVAPYMPSDQHQFIRTISFATSHRHNSSTPGHIDYDANPVYLPKLRCIQVDTLLFCSRPLCPILDNSGYTTIVIRTGYDYLHQYMPWKTKSILPLHGSVQKIVYIIHNCVVSPHHWYGVSSGPIIHCLPHHIQQVVILINPVSVHSECWYWLWEALNVACGTSAQTLIIVGLESINPVEVMDTFPQMKRKNMMSYLRTELLKLITLSLDKTSGGGIDGSPQHSNKTKADKKLRLLSHREYLNIENNEDEVRGSEIEQWIKVVDNRKRRWTRPVN